MKDAALLLGIPRDKIRELVEKGELPAYKIGGEFIRFRKEQVEAIRNEILTEVGLAAQKPPPKENSKYAAEIVSEESFAERVLDFFYFKDFYIVAAVVMLLLLFFIFR